MHSTMRPLCVCVLITPLLAALAHISIALLELAFHPTREWAAEVEQLWNDYLHEISPQTQYRVVSLEEGDAMPHDPRWDALA